MPCCVTNITATAVAATATEVTITIPATTLVSGQKYRIFVPQIIPSAGAGLPIVIANDADTVPLWTCGDARSVLGFQLRVLRVENCCSISHCLPLQYVDTGIDTNPAHFTVMRRLPCAAV